MGDFNEVLYSNERFGQGPQDDERLAKFKELLNSLNLTRCDLLGAEFT